LNNFLTFDIKISERLKAAADEIEYPVIADIGCDHAYTAIYAVLSGKAEYAYACDINEAPLRRAAENIKKYGTENKIETKIGAGLSPLFGTNAETVIIAGLGGYLINEILSEGLKYVPGVKQLILQPMSEIPNVRRHLHNAGFRIKNERVIDEEPKYYFILNCAPGYEEPYNDAEYEFGKLNIQHNTKIFVEYLKDETSKTRKIISGIDDDTDSEKTRERKRELIKKIAVMEQLLSERRR